MPEATPISFPLMEYNNMASARDTSQILEIVGKPSSVRSPHNLTNVCELLKVFNLLIHLIQLNVVITKGSLNRAITYRSNLHYVTFLL
jgi:hypothetical protein